MSSTEKTYTDIIKVWKKKIPELNDIEDFMTHHKKVFDYIMKSKYADSTKNQQEYTGK